MRVPTRINPQTEPVAARQPYLQGQGADWSGLAREVQGIAGDLRADQLKREEFDLNSEFVKHTNRRRLDFEARTQVADPGAAGFTERLATDYEGEDQALVQRYKDQGYSEESTRRFELQLGQLRGTMVGQGLAFQGQSAKVNGSVRVGELGTQLSQYASAQPDAIGSSLDELEHNINLLPGLTAPEKQEMFQRERVGVIMGAGQGLARSRPQDVIRALDPQSLVTPSVGGRSANAWGNVAVDVANEFGLNPTELAAVMSFESGLDPNRQNASGHLGLIQFGKAEQAQYGITKGSTPEQWTKAISQFFKDRGLQKGASIEDVYSTILTGSPGNYDRADSNGTTVRNAVPRIIRDHLAVADAWLGPREQAPVTEATSSAPLSPMVAGNLPLTIQNRAQNADGSISTVRTISIGTDQGEVLIPTVVDNKVVSNEEAIKHYKETGENFGTFKTVEDADKYAEWLHNQHAEELNRETGKTGIPALDLMDAQQRAQVLAWAKTASTQTDAYARAAVQDKVANEKAAISATGQSANPVTDAELAVLGPQAAFVKQELEALRKAGPAISGMQTASAADIMAQVEALKPTDTAASDFQEKNQVYQALRQSAQQNIAARDRDPGAYVIAAFPQIAQQLDAAKTPADRKAAYGAMDQAYEKLGIPPSKRFYGSNAQTEAIGKQYEMAGPEQKLGIMEGLAAEMGWAGAGRTLGRGAGPEVAGDFALYSTLRTLPTYRATFSRVLAGRAIIEKDSARRPSEAVTSNAFGDGLGKAIHNLDADLSRLYNEAAAALYVKDGGNTGNQALTDPGLYKKALREALGGQSDNPDTGIVNKSQGQARDWTILPVGVTGKQLDDWVEGLSPGDLTRLSVNGRQPTDKSGRHLPLQTIVDEGVFVMLAPGIYGIKLGSDGKLVGDGRGNAFQLHLDKSRMGIR